MKKLILEYHLVDTVYEDYNNININPDYFEQQILFMAEKYQIVDLEELLKDRPDEDGIQIALTFDDVCSGFYKNVYPILRRLHIPAIVFPVTEYLEKKAEHWMNELHRLIFSGDAYPNSFYLNHPLYNYVFETENFERRQKMYRVLRIVLQRMTVKERENIFTDLRNWAYTDRGNRNEYLSISLKECRDLAREGLISFGAHTKSHTALGSMPYDEQFTEIYESKRYLESVLGIKIKHFSYPFGSFDIATKKILKKLGFESSCGISRRWFESVETIDKYELPRFVPPNKNNEDFCRWMNWILDEKDNAEKNNVQKERSFISYMGRLKDDFYLIEDSKKFFVFGAGGSGAYLLKKMEMFGFAVNMGGFIDNNIAKKDCIYCGYKVYSPDQLNDNKYNICVWKYSTEILKQLKSMNVGGIHLITEV